MKLFKYILTYTFWCLIAILMAICCVTLFLGATFFSSEEEWWQVILNRFYQIGLIQVGFYIGCLVAFLYILIDVFYLRSKLRNRRGGAIRFLVLLELTLIVAVIYYIVEKIIDVI